MGGEKKKPKKRGGGNAEPGGPQGGDAFPMRKKAPDRSESLSQCRETGTPEADTSGGLEYLGRNVWGLGRLF